MARSALTVKVRYRPDKGNGKGVHREVEVEGKALARLTEIA
jgi:hypothetical protein